MTLPRYPKYKDSGVEWLGEVPEHWELSPLKRIVSTPITDGPHETPAFPDEGVPFASAEAVSSGRLDFTKIRGFISPVDHARFSAKYKPRRGDIFMVKSGATTGITAIVDTDEDFNIWSPLAAIRCGTECVPQYMLNFFRSRNFLEAITLNWSFGTQQNIGMGVIENLPIAVPPIVEQESIASFLICETEKIDALVEEQRRLIELLKEKRQAVISHAVTKGLNPDAPMKDSGIEWLGEVPAHWSAVRLKFMAYVQGGVAKGRNLEGQKTIEVPYLRVANVQDGYLDLEEVTLIEIAENELERYALQSGDVLMNEGGDFDKLGRGHIWRGEIPGCIHQNHVFAVRPKGIESEWLNLVTSAECGRFYFMSRSKQSTNLASISSSNIQEMPIPCPPIEERSAIVEHVRLLTNEFNSLLAEATRAIDLLQERRTALISAAVTGKMDVRGVRATEVA